jgi:hypothetical protein
MHSLSIVVWRFWIGLQSAGNRILGRIRFLLVSYWIYMDVTHRSMPQGTQIYVVQPHLQLEISVSRNPTVPQCCLFIKFRGIQPYHSAAYSIPTYKSHLIPHVKCQQPRTTMARNILEGLSRSPIGTIKSSSLQPAIVTSLTQLDVVSLTSYDQLPTTTESETIIVPGVYPSQQRSPKAKADAHRLSRGLETSSTSRPPATRRRATTCPRKLPQLSA